MKKLQCLSFIVVLAAFIFSPAFGQDKEVTVSGTVVDSVTGNPLSGVVILLAPGIIPDTSNLDTAFTQSDGKFNKTVLVADNTTMMTYITLKGGYKSKMGNSSIGVNNAVDFGTIALSEETYREIVIIGRVLDSSDNQPIPTALVILSNSSLILDTIYDSVFTSDIGVFSHKMQIGTGGIGPLPPQVIYSATKDAYVPKEGYQAGNVDTCDLGDILLAKINIPIIYDPYSKIKISNVKPNRIEIYSVKGQMLYSGAECNLNKLFHLSIITLQPIIIRYKFNNEVLYSTTLMPISE